MADTTQASEESHSTDTIMAKKLSNFSEGASFLTRLLVWDYPEERAERIPSNIYQSSCHKLRMRLLTPIVGFANPPAVGEWLEEQDAQYSNDVRWMHHASMDHHRDVAKLVSHVTDIMLAELKDLPGETEGLEKVTKEVSDAKTLAQRYVNCHGFSFEDDGSIIWDLE